MPNSESRLAFESKPAFFAAHSVELLPANGRHHPRFKPRWIQLAEFCPVKTAMTVFANAKKLCRTDDVSPNQIEI
jgi:hypothetical protein